MAVAARFFFNVPSYVVPPVANLRFRLLRDGEIATGRRRLRFFRDWDSVGKLELVFEAELGEYTRTVPVDLATLLAQGEWLVTGVDPNLPRRTRATYMTFTGGGTFTFNITGSEGGGAVGDPATIPARVRVDGELVGREVVVLEKPSDGEWRLAGFGPVPGGVAEIDLRITDGNLYALGLDDWGIAFTPDLAVSAGQTIRPTQFGGWLYRITESGTLPSAEPLWWAAEGGNAPRDLGTARAIAVRYYQPLALGPYPVEML